MVQAAEQDGIALEEALLEAQLTAEAYHAGRTSTIAEIASGAAAYQAYDAALTEAQDALHRPVTPLYDDVAAWMAYNLALDAGPASDLLAKHGLTLGDVARLGRHWQAAMAEPRGGEGGAGALVRRGYPRSCLRSSWASARRRRLC